MLLPDHQNSPIYKAYSLIQRRFILLSFVMPLCYSFSMGADSVFLSKNAKSVLLKSFFKYAACVNESFNTEQECRNKLILTTGPILSMAAFFLIDVFMVVLAAYCLMPKEARKFWSRLKKRIVSCISKRSRADQDSEY